MKNILIVTSGIKGPTLAGGIATAFYNLAILLKNNGFHVSILYASHPYYGAKINDPAYWIEYYQKNGINFIPLEDTTPLYGQDMMQRSFKIYSYLKNNSTQYDKIIFHDHGGTAYYTFLAKKLELHFENNDLVISAHGNTRLSDYFNRRFPKDHNALVTYFLEQKSIEYADYVISPSAYYISWYKEQGYKISDDRSSVIQNVLLKNDMLSQVETSTPKERAHFCFFGRVEKLKGIFVFLEALRILISNHPELNEKDRIKISIVGNLTQINNVNIKDYIDEKIKEFNFDVVFKTSFNSEEALTYIASNRGIIVNPTLGETSSYTVLEAITYNIRFLSSGIQGIKELIDEQYYDQVFFEPGNANQLATKLYEYYDDSKLGYAKRSISNEDTNKHWINFLGKSLSPKNVQIPSLKADPTISVCIPTTGQRDIISDTLVSLSNQDYKNFEIVIVIDGGDLTSFEEVAQDGLNAVKNKKISLTIERLSHRYKAGVCNYAVENLVKGDYVLFFDDDDIAKEHMISTYAKVLKNDASIDMATDFCQCFAVDNERGTNVAFSPEKVVLKHISLGVGNAKSANLIINYFGKANFIVKRDKYLELGGMSETSIMTPYVDWDLFVKASTNNLNVEIIPEVLYYYRMNSQDSIFYTTHDYEDIQGQEKRYLAHKKIVDSITSSENVNSGLKDYVLYAQSKLALPPVTKAQKNELQTVNELQKQVDDLLWQKDWYEKTYERLPWWWKKVGALIRKVRILFK